MDYSEFQPAASLRPFVECYWAAEGVSEKSSSTQKIVPDGFTEIVFDYGDFYTFRDCRGNEKIQSRTILAGQITQPIHLTPSGNSGVIGIKFKPTGIWKLFGWNMADFTDDARDLDQLPNTVLTQFIQQLMTLASMNEKVHHVEELLVRQLPFARSTVADEIIKAIDSSMGDISVTALHEQFGIPVRKLERMFKEQVGVSAKRYARIVRFRHIFKLLQKPDWSKAEATYLAGYFDQAHFNKEFKEFSGEDPSSYFAQHHEFANFFLNRPVVFLQD